MGDNFVHAGGVEIDGIPRGISYNISCTINSSISSSFRISTVRTRFTFVFFSLRVLRMRAVGSFCQVTMLTHASLCGTPSLSLGSPLSFSLHMSLSTLGDGVHRKVAVLPAVEQPRERHDHVRLPPGGRGGPEPLRQLSEDAVPQAEP